MKNTLVIFLVIFSSTLLLGQSKKYNCAVIDFFIPPLSEFKAKQNKAKQKLLSLNTNDYNDIYNKVKKTQSYVLEKLVKDDRFVLLERSKINIIKKERELQKSMDFIDGYVTNQGQAIGTDYLILGDFELNEMSLTISVHNVADNKLIASESVMLKRRLSTNFKSIKPLVEAATERLIEKFAPSYITLLEVTSARKNSVRQVLIAGGLGRGLETGDGIDFKILEERMVDGKTLTYYKTIGKGKIEKIEDMNFSLVSVKQGGKKIAALLEAEEKIYCSKILK